MERFALLSNPAFDAAFKEFQSAVGVDAQKAACAKIEQISNDDTPVIIPYFYNYLSGNSKKFTGRVHLRARPDVPVGGLAAA